MYISATDTKTKWKTEILRKTLCVCWSLYMTAYIHNLQSCRSIILKKSLKLVDLKYFSLPTKLILWTDFVKYRIVGMMFDNELGQTLSDLSPEILQLVSQKY